MKLKTPSARPTYAPEPGDTQDDLVRHLQADIQWLETVIREVADCVDDNDMSSAFIILKYCGVER